jgi:hypothetical protein
MVRPRVVTAELRHEAALGLERGRQKLALALVVCLPIPLLAMSGLAVPLPTAVYRVAAAVLQTTEGLARAFTGTEQETRVLSTRSTTDQLEPRPQRSASRLRVAADAASRRAQVSVRDPRVAPARARSYGGAPRTRSPARQPAHTARVRTPSAPASEQRTEVAAPAAPGAAAPAPPHAPAPAQAPAQELTKERPPSEPLQRPTGIVSTEPAPIKPPAAPPPATPPAPTPEPGLLDPVTEPLEPVTKPLEPVTKQLAPVTDALQPITRPLERVTGRLGLLNP